MKNRGTLVALYTSKGAAEFSRNMCGGEVSYVSLGVSEWLSKLLLRFGVYHDMKF